MAKKAAKRMEVDVDRAERMCAQIMTDCEQVVDNVRTTEQVSVCAINLSHPDHVTNPFFYYFIS